MSRPALCTYCGQLGHRADKCPRRVHSVAPSALERWKADLVEIERELAAAAGPRRDPSKAEIVAALCLAHPDRDGAPVITRDEARTLGPGEVFDLFVSRVIIDHITPRIVGGPDHHANYQFLRRGADNTAKTSHDQSEIAKTKRIRKARAAHLRELIARADADGQMTRTTPSASPKLKGRGFSKGSRPIAGSRASHFKRSFNGKVTRREATP